MIAYVKNSWNSCWSRADLNKQQIKHQRLHSNRNYLKWSTKWGEKAEKDNEQSLSDLVYLTCATEGHRIVILNDNVPNWTNSRTLSSKNTKKNKPKENSTPKKQHNQTKFDIVKDKMKILKRARKKKRTHYIDTRIFTDLLWEIMEVERQRKDIFKVMKGKTKTIQDCQSRIVSPAKLSLENEGKRTLHWTSKS